jgi:hypothetical protein
MGIFDDFSVHFRLIIPSISHLSQRGIPALGENANRSFYAVKARSGSGPASPPALSFI